MEAALNYESGKFIYVSSVAVYGSPTDLPVSETGPIRPIYSYGIAKQCGEEYVKYYGTNKGLDFHIVRYGNVYGPRQPIYGEVGVVAIFTQKVINGEPLTVFGGGDHLRDYLFIDDAVEATVRLLSLPGSDTFDVTSGEPTSVNQVVQAFEAAEKRSLEIIPQPQRPNELGKFFADISKLSAALKWIPETGILSGVEATLDFYRGIK